MRDLLILASHLVVTFVKLLRRGGVRAVAAESLALKHQLLISNRSHHRAPNPTTLDLIVLALTALFVSPAVLRSSALSSSRPRYCNFHKMLVCEKYRRLFSSSSHRHNPVPKGRLRNSLRPSSRSRGAIRSLAACGLPSKSLIRSAQIDKDVVCRVLASHDRPGSRTEGPSWLPFIAHLKDRLWSVDLFRCESIRLKSYWVLVVGRDGRLHPPYRRLRHRSEIH
jgi:putative transposase